MKTTIILLLIFFNMNLSAQTIDWKNAPLNPAAVFYTTNHYNVNGPIQEFSAKNRGGEIFYLHFNESGKLVEKITSQAAGTSKIQFTYQYDAKGKLISETTAFLDSKGAKSYESTTSITVNDKGLVTKKGSMICNYDNNDRLISVINKDKSGKVIYKQEFVYNTLGQVISEKITDPHAATGVMETEEFKFSYTKNNRGGWDVVMHIYKEGKLATKGSIPLITSSFVRQKREQIFNNPQKFSFDEAGLEAFDPNIVRVMVDQYNNLRGQFVIRLKQDFYPVNVTYYNNILSLAKPKQSQENNATYNNSTINPAELPGQTTETRLYNGKYNQQTALQKVNNYIDVLKGEGNFTFKKTDELSKYHFTANWQQNLGEPNKKLVVVIEYIIGEKDLTLKLKNATYFQSREKFLILTKNDKNESVRKLYRNQEGMFINALFGYLDIKNNFNQNNYTDNKPVTYSKNEIASITKNYQDQLKKSKSDGDQVIYKIIKDQKAENKTEDQIASYFYEMYKSLYSNDKESSFMLVYRIGTVSSYWGIQKKVKQMMTPDQYKYFSQQAYNYVMKKN